MNPIKRLYLIILVWRYAAMHEKLFSECQIVFSQFIQISFEKMHPMTPGFELRVKVYKPELLCFVPTRIVTNFVDNNPGIEKEDIVKAMTIY